MSDPVTVPGPEVQIYGAHRPKIKEISSYFMYRYVILSMISIAAGQWLEHTTFTKIRTRK